MVHLSSYLFDTNRMSNHLILEKTCLFRALESRGERGSCHLQHKFTWVLGFEPECSWLDAQCFIPQVISQPHKHRRLLRAFSVLNRDESVQSPSLRHVSVDVGCEEEHLTTAIHNTMLTFLQASHCYMVRHLNRRACCYDHVTRTQFS